MGSKRYSETSYHFYNINSPGNPKELYQSDYKFECAEVCLDADIEGDVVFGRKILTANGYGKYLIGRYFSKKRKKKSYNIRPTNVNSADSFSQT
jgi:hypothetical protein